jgi:YfiR/HmsC-like
MDASMTRARLALVAGVFACGLMNAAAAEPVTAHDVKAAFIYNFAKFAEWPADAVASEQELSICVVGDDAVAAALERAALGHTIQGRHLRVYTVKADDRLLNCRLLYVSGLASKATAQLIAPLGNLPVLTISDSDAFATSGGIAELFLENGRMRFAINVSAAGRARIALSAKMLSLAKIVKDDPNGQR